MKKKLQLRAVAFCLALLGLVSHVEGATFTFVSGDPSVRTNWSPVPVNFTTAGQTFIINSSAAALGANWTVSGAGSVIQIGNGAGAFNFTIPTTFKVTGTINVTTNATLTINNVTNPTLGTLASGSTVVYSDAAAQTVLAATYDNLTLGGSGTKTLANTASSTVSSLLTINSGVIFQLNTNNTYTLTLNGTLAGAGTIKGGNLSNLTIGGSGSFGTIIPSAAPLTINNFIINRSGLGSITLGGNVTARTSCNFSNGVLVLNGNTLSLGGTLTFPVASTNGTITGSATSNISITATSITNDLYMTSGAQTLNNLTLNATAGQTLTLGSNLTVSGVYTQTKGIVNINGNTLTLSGTATFASSVANGTTTGSATSNLIITATTIGANSLFMTVGSQTLNNLTLNSPAQTLTLGTPLTVSGTYSQTNGIVKLNAQTLTLNGTVTFPAASANGTITGSNTSNLSISSTSVANTLFFTVGALALKNFTVNCPAQTIKLGTALTLAGTLTHTSGIIDLNGQTLTCNGPVVFPASAANGSFTGSSSSSLSIATPAGGVITNSMYMTQTSSSTNSLLNVTLNRTGGTLTLGNPLNLIGALIPTVGTVASGGNLTLVASSATLTAYIGTIGVAAGASVTGNVNVQAYEAGGNTGWTLMGSPGLTGRTMADWSNSFFVTCPTCPDGDGSAQNGGTAFTSIDSYLETAGGLMSAAPRYIGISSSTDPINVGQGYWVYLGNGPSATGDIIINMTGPVNQGNVALPLTITNAGGGTNATDHGYNLLANPYPAPISWTSLRAGNAKVSATMYVYNPDLNAYATFISTSGISSPAVGSGGIGDKIPAGQGFYVKVSAATTLTAKETFKAASNQQLLRTTSTSNIQQTASTSQPELFRLQASGSSMKSETAVYFDPNGSMYFNSDYDALSLGSDPGFLGIVVDLSDTAYTIKGLPPLTQNVSMPVKTITGTTGSYQITAADLQNLPAGACIKLHDKYMNTDWDLRTGPYNCTLNDTETVSRFVLNITIDPSLSVSGNSQNPTCANSANGYMVASATSGSAPWNYYWKDANNNIIKTSLNKTTADTLLNANGGNYSVDINTVGSCNNGTVSFTLQGSLSANAAFVPSTTLDSLINDTVSIYFANTSTNASSYVWDFGDGTQATTTSMYHTYTGAGTYTVALTAYDQVCGDTSVYYQTITIDTTSSTSTAGIKSVSLVQKNGMEINRDAAGYYVQFNYQTKTNAVISVQNLLGEKVVADIKQDNVANNKTYIPLGNTENNVLIISVNTSSGEKTFKKVINY